MKKPPNSLPEGSQLDGDKLTVTLPYQPRPLQAEFHRNLKRFNVLVCHRRFGKTVFSVNEIIRKAMECKLVRPQYAFISPVMKQSKRNAWNMFKEFTAPIPYVKFNEAELRIDFPNGAVIHCLGAENADSLRGLYLDGVVLDEVAQMDPEVWTKVIRPALADRAGWAIFIGTKEGKNFFYDLYQMADNKDDWYRALITADSSGYVKQEELDALLEASGPDVYAQEMGDAWDAAIKGSYYSSILNAIDNKGQIGLYSWDPSFPVITAWDIGMLDKTCIWFAQVKQGNIYLIDYYEKDDQVLGHYASEVLSKPYTYKHHILPHDAKQRSFDTGRTRQHQLESLGLKVIIAEKTGLIDGINSVRTLLPRCFFNKEKCNDGIKALRHYRTEYDAKIQAYTEKPKHDWSSHASDAFRYLATTIKTTTNHIPHFKNEAAYDPFNFNVTKRIEQYDPFSPREL